MHAIGNSTNSTNTAVATQTNKIYAQAYKEIQIIIWKAILNITIANS